jgi:peptidyl-prolyl cis-trans isomerase D
MSVIQKIRDKYARLAVIAIAVALTGFILTDYISGRSRTLFSGSSTTLGKVDGTKIDQAEFEKKVQVQEQNEKAQGRAETGEAGRQQIISQLWDQEVNQILLKEEFEKLGMLVGAKEMNDMLYGADPHQYAKQYLGNPNTGQYDPSQAAQIIAQIKRGKNAEQKNQLDQLLEAMKQDRLLQKYKNLVAGSVHFPKWYLEKQNAENSLLGKISYVNIPYTTISDTAKDVVITDKEIEDYINKNKDQYKQENETRTIEYILFSAAPNSGDSAKTKKDVEDLKKGFADTKEAEAFLVKNGSAMPANSVYVAKSTIRVPAKDSIFKLSKEEVYGPYLDGGSYVLAKLLDIKDLPDSVKARHILIQTSNPQSGQQLVEDSVAKKRIDSIALAIKNGARFDSLATKLSDDKGSATKGGLLSTTNSEYFAQGQMVQAFNDSCFFGKKGERKIVKTEYGYHLIEILDQKNFEPHYKVAYFGKRIDASDQTDQDAQNAAMQFVGESRDLKSFDANFDKNLKAKGNQKLFAPNIGSHAFDIPGIGVSRKFIKSIFAANKGEVIQAERIGDNYVAAVVTEIDKAGEMTVTQARPGIEIILRNKKKAEVIKKKIGTVASLDSVASAMNQKIQKADSLRFNSRENSPLAFEYKLIGAAFNPANNGKIINEPIDGVYGIYIIRVNNVSATAVENADINATRKSLENQERMKILLGAQGNPYGAYNQREFDPAAILKKAATIKDNRDKFY